MSAVPGPLRRSCAMSDLFEGCYVQTKIDLAASIESQDWDKFLDILEPFLSSNAQKQLFIGAGSIYPALAEALRKHDYQGVLRAIEFIVGRDDLTDLMTFEILLCQAVCHWQLGNQEVSVRTVRSVEQKLGRSFDNLIKKLNCHSEREEKQLYEDLLMNYRSLSFG